MQDDALAGHLSRRSPYLRSGAGGNRCLSAGRRINRGRRRFDAIGHLGPIAIDCCPDAGCVGTIVHGTVRDVPQTTQLGFGVFALGTSPYDSMNRQKVVAVDIPVEIDGVCFHPGDLVLADVDGVVVVPREVEQQTIERALVKVSKENEILQAIQGGLKATEAWKRYGVL